MIFKGGNIIKAVIDKTEDNIRKAIEHYDDANNNDDLKEIYSLNDFNPTKRSDSDFTILIDFKKISANNIILWTQIIIGCEYIAYMISDYIRHNYDMNNGTVKFNSKDIPIINITKNIDKLDKLVDTMNSKFADTINRTSEYLIKIKEGTNDESENQYVNSNKNIVTSFAKLMSSGLLTFDTKLNFKPSVYHDSKTAMPHIRGYIINDKIKYGLDDVTKDNSMSFGNIKKLLRNSDSKTDISKTNISKTDANVTDANYNDMEIYFANQHNIPLIADDTALGSVSDNPNTKYYGYSFGGKDVDNNFVFNNFKNSNIYQKDVIQNIVSKKYKNDSPLYISSNRTLRFTKKGVQTAFNLIRMKHNFKIFFELPYSIKKVSGTNTDIRYIYTDIPGEFIDITVPTYADNMLSEYMNNFDKYISKRYIQVNNESIANYRQPIYTYSNYGLIHDLEFILFTVTGDKPWDDNKYSKRLERLFRIYFAEIKNVLKVNEKVKNQLEYILQTLSLMRDKFISYRQDNNMKNIQIIKQYIDIIKIELKILDDNINMNQSDKQNLFYELFNNIMGPVVKELNNINKNPDIDNIIIYLDDVIKYYKIFVENIILPMKGNLLDIQLGGKKIISANWR